MIQEDAFMAASDDDMVSCNYLPEVNLRRWKEGGYCIMVLEITQLKPDRTFSDI